MKVKIDTGAQGNVMPIRMFHRMFPSWLDAEGYPLPGTTDCQPRVTLTAYNGSVIKNYGSVLISSKSPAVPWTDCIFHVAETPGPAILALPSSRQLQLVTLHNLTSSNISSTTAYDVAAVLSKPRVSSIEGLKATFPDRLYAIGHFREPYHLTLKQDVPPVVQAARIYPIQLRDEIQEELQNLG